MYALKIQVLNPRSCSLRHLLAAPAAATQWPDSASRLAWPLLPGQGFQSGIGCLCPRRGSSPDLFVAAWRESAHLSTRNTDEDGHSHQHVTGVSPASLSCLGRGELLGLQVFSSSWRNSFLILHFNNVSLRVCT